MKLTGIARGSLEELRLDYEDYLRQRELPVWAVDCPALTRFKKQRCKTIREFRLWVADEVTRAGKSGETRTHGSARTGTDTHGREHGQTPTHADRHGRRGEGGGAKPDDLLVSTIVANGALSLLNVCIYLLGRQLQAQADAFEREGDSRSGSTASVPRRDDVGSDRSRGLEGRCGDTDGTRTHTD